MLQVAVGCDPRLSGPLLMPAALAGLQSAGAAAVDVGLSTTPAMFYGIIAPGEMAAVAGSGHCFVPLHLCQTGLTLTWSHAAVQRLLHAAVHRQIMIGVIKGIQGAWVSVCLGAKVPPQLLPFW